MKKIASLISPLAYFLSTSIALAQGDAESVVGKITAPGSIIDSPAKTGDLITSIVVFITVLAGLYAMWQFLSGGFGYISSGGDKAKVQQATQQITMAVLGLAVMAASFIIGSLVGRLLFGESFDLFTPKLLTL